MFEAFFCYFSTSMRSSLFLVIMMIAHNSRTRERTRRGRWKGNMEEFEGGRGGDCWLRGNGAIQSATCCTTCKSGWVGIWHERFENVGNVWGRNPGWGYTGSHRSPTLIDALPSGHPFSRLIRYAGIRWAYSTPHQNVTIDNIAQSYFNIDTW